MPSQGVRATGSENLSRAAHQGAPRGGSQAPPGSYLGRDCCQTQGDRGRAGWRGGTAAAFYKAQGVRVGVGVPAGAALVQAAVPSADFGAVPGSKRCEEGPGRPS